MATSHRFTRPDGFYTKSTEDYGYPPYNSTTDALPQKPWGRKWPQYVNGVWMMVEDHRERKASLFDSELEQDATEFWLPGDTYDTPARHMHTPGPLPEGVLMVRPEQPLDEVKTAKLAEINAGHEAALAGAVALADPSPAVVAVEAGLLAVDDPEGLQYISDMMAARRDALLAEVEAAETAEDVQSVEVNYAV